MAHRAAAALAALALALAGCGGSHHPPRSAPSADPADPVTHAEALNAIARAHHGTRAAGTAGDAATADYIADRLTAAGFAVRRQRLRVLTSTIDAGPRLTVGGTRVDVLPLQFTGSGDVTGPLRAARGFGCRPADYAGLPRGAVAVARRGRCYLRVKALRAQQAGAGALLIRAAHPL